MWTQQIQQSLSIMSILPSSTFSLSLSLSLSLSGKTLHKLSQCMYFGHLLSLSLSVDGAPEPQHNNIKACLQTVTDSLGAKKCTSLCLARCIEDYYNTTEYGFPYKW